MTSIRHKRGTRAQIESAAANGELQAGELYFITDENRLTIGTANNDHQPVARQDEGSVAAPVQTIEIGGRWYCQPDNRWIGFSFAVGAKADNHYISAGNGAEPQLQWNQLGPIIMDGSVIKRLRLAGACNTAEVSGVNIRLFHQTGPWQGTWDSAGETTRTTLLSVNDLDFSNADMKRYIFDVDQSVTGDGFLLMSIQPIGTITTTRYFQSSISVELQPA